MICRYKSSQQTKKCLCSYKSRLKKFLPVEEPALYLKEKKSTAKHNAQSTPLLTVNQGTPAYTGTFSTFKPKSCGIFSYFKPVEEHWLSIIINSIFTQI